MEEEEELGLETGDLVLFDRRCESMSLFGAVLCWAAKLFSGSRWDHVGVIVEDPLGELRLLEAGFSGVQAHRLRERLRRSQAHNVAVRKLHWPRNLNSNANMISISKRCGNILI
jgi:hypothetical protein